jgi:hypothetical protein
MWSNEKAAAAETVDFKILSIKTIPQLRSNPDAEVKYYLPQFCIFTRVQGSPRN